MNSEEILADNIFMITENSIGDLEKAELPDEGCLVICQFSGKLRYEKNHLSRYLNEGECLVADLRSGYRFSYEGNEEARSAYSVASGTLVKELLELYHVNDGCVVPVPDVSGMLFKIQKISGGRIADIKERKELAALYFHTMVVAIDRARKEYEKKAKSTAALIKDYIDAHIEDRLQLENVSSVFFISKTQIFRLFKEAYGIAPMQYFLQKKIELAKRMLADSDKHISDIAEQLSFTDAKHFSKTFKKITGELPKNYRYSAKAEKSKKN